MVDAVRRDARAAPGGWIERRIDRERFQPQAAPPETLVLRSALEALRRGRW